MPMVLFGVFLLGATAWVSFYAGVHVGDASMIEKGLRWLLFIFIGPLWIFGLGTYLVVKSLKERFNVLP